MICVEKKKYVLDEAAIQFTKTFYSEVFNGYDICTAFDHAKSAVEFQLNDREAEIFILFLSEDKNRDITKLKKQGRNKMHDCYSLPVYEEG